MHKPKTSSEINLFHIEKGLKKLKKGTVTVQEAELNKRFERLKRDNPYLYVDLHAEYVETVRNLNK